ncbi:P-loop containing nucleoside triphosphate hydrolase protein, partial [Mycena leptocephala]
VMGNTGTGKSSFVKLITGDSSIKVNDGLESETADIQVFHFVDPTSGHKVRIVDTPGFDDSRKGVTDTDILKRSLISYSKSRYDAKRRLNGLVYLQRITDNKFGGQSGRNLLMFKKLCGDQTHKNIVVLTTFWDKVTNKQEAVKREEELKAKFFWSLVAGGACFMRSDRTIEAVRAVLGHIFTLLPTNVLIQEEIRVEGKSLEDTAVGSVHREEVERIIAQHTKEMGDLKAEM